MRMLLAVKSFHDGRSLELVQGDITAEKVDAIVNAANARLQHGGGVAAVISLRGGPLVQQESDAWVRRHGPVTHARPAVTTAGTLPCRFILHAVGPVWGEGDEDAKLRSAVTGCLACAEELQLGSLALPAISTGIFGFPKERAAAIILGAIAAHFDRGWRACLQIVRIMVYDPPTAAAFAAAWDAWKAAGA
jgi:O-acetyl-ADP-ribose deacetylase (regulator of RNase III)